MRRQPRATVLSPIVSQRLTPTLDKEQHSGLDRVAKLADTGEVTPSTERRRCWRSPPPSADAELDDGSPTP